MQVDVFFELDEQADKLEIPWASSDDPANRYYPLRQEPVLLEQVAEARANPPLRALLVALNAPDSFFATAKCDTWQAAELTPAERAAFAGARHKSGSYVDLVFARDDFNFLRGHYQGLVDRLAQGLAGAPLDAARAELCVRRCFYRAAARWGFYLTVYVFGYGADAAAAERNWAAANALGVACTRLSGVLAVALRAAQAE